MANPVEYICTVKYCTRFEILLSEAWNMWSNKERRVKLKRNVNLEVQPLVRQQRLMWTVTHDPIRQYSQLIIRFSYGLCMSLFSMIEKVSVSSAATHLPLCRYIALEAAKETDNVAPSREDRLDSSCAKCHESNKGSNMWLWPTKKLEGSLWPYHVESASLFSPF